MPERVLLVDDDPNLLSALQRQLRKQFDLVIAQGGEAALTEIIQAAEAREPFAAVLCDMRMPGLDGIETLRQIRESSPETVRMMLTGNADQQTAIDAINRGSIFRFYTKPTNTDVLSEGIEAALAQHRLIIAERDLMEKTVTGSIKVLTDVVSLNDPVGYALSCRLRDWVRVIAVEFKLPMRWHLDIAAMLVPLGQVGIPPELIAKKRRGEKLSDAERAMFERAPETARNLIANVPRLSKVAEVVLLQDKGFDGSGFPADGPKGTDIPFDARLLRILKDLAEECTGGYPTTAVFAALERKAAQYDPRLLVRVRDCLLSTVPLEAPPEVELPVSVLQPGNVVLTDIMATDGRLILAADTRLSAAQVERLRSLGLIYTFIEPVRVRL